MFNMTFKQVLIVRERFEELKENVRIKDTYEARRCFMKKGQSKITAKFKKNYFTPTETAEADVYIDNSKCSLSIVSVSFAVE